VSRCGEAGALSRLTCGEASHGARAPGESYSDVILRLAAEGCKQGRTAMGEAKRHHLLKV
jgi:hypothetical protein